MGRIDRLRSIAAQVGITLVVGEDQDDVGFFGHLLQRLCGVFAEFLHAGPVLRSPFDAELYPLRSRKRASGACARW